MWNNKEIDKELETLQKLSKTLNQKLTVDLKILDLTNEKMLRNAPNGQKEQMEKVKAMSNKVIILAKEGKTEEVQNIINQMTNECKNKQ